MAFPDLANAHAMAVLLLIVLAFLLSTEERIPQGTSSLVVVVLLIEGFELYPYSGPSGAIRPADFFHGFGHAALVAVCALMVAGQALVRTRALEPEHADWNLDQPAGGVGRRGYGHGALRNVRLSRPRAARRQLRPP